MYSQTETIEIEVKEPHSDKQHQLVYYPGNIVFFGGRRWGKTDGATLRIYKSMAADPGLYWWVGLSWKSASMKRAWREISKIGRQALRALGLPERGHVNKSTHEIKIPGLGEVWFRTADNPSSLAGEGIKGAVIDEFTLMQEIVWNEYLEATLLDYGGWACFTGVPKGRNWGGVLWESCKSWNGWLQLHATTYENPYIDKNRINEIKGRLTEDLFNQEYMALVVADAGSVFRRVMDAATAVELDKAQEARQYVAGVDVASKVDFTAVSVFDVEAKEQVYLDRFNRVEYPVLEDRLHGIYKRFNLTAMTIEDNSIGQGVVDHLRQRGMNIITFTTTNTTKMTIIQQLASAFEHDEIKILNDPVQVSELQAFEGKRLAGGGFSYSAPDGMHDDTVMAMAIGWHGIGSTFSVLWEA